MAIDLKTYKSFQAGNFGAFERIVRQETPRVLNFARRYVREESLLEDLVQESWLAIWISREKSRYFEKFESWIFQIIRTTIFKELRSRYLRVDVFYYDESDLVNAIADSQLQPDEMAQLKEWRSILNTEIQRLDSQSQEIITLRFDAGMNLCQISEILNTPYGTICSKMNRAIKSIRKQLERQGYRFDINSIHFGKER